MKPLVSIVVPIYNVENYLENSVNSLIFQTYESIEIILVNDGSTDNSKDIMQHLAKKDQRIACYDKENGGLSSARNYGMGKMRGEYVFFMDSDDTIKNNTIELMVNKSLQENADLVVCDMEYLYDTNDVVFASGGEFDTTNYKETPELLFINNSACNKLIHKSLLEGFYFPEGLWYEDLGSIPILLTKANCVAKVNEPLYVYYQRTGSISHRVNMKIFDIYKAIKLVEESVSVDVKSLYVVHGLDLTTLRIKDFNDKSVRKDYLKENMRLLKQYYSNYKEDPKFKTYSLKKKIIFKLLDLRLYSIVLFIYG